MSGDLVLKVEFEGDLRRVRVALAADDDNGLTVAKVRAAVMKLFELPADVDVALKYRDDEGDLCTVVAATLQDCFAAARGGPVRLVAERGSEPAAPNAEAALAAMVDDEPADEGEGAVAPSCGASGRRCRGFAPRKLFWCIGGLRASGQLSAETLASLMLHFLPLLARRLSRKQEKFNRLGAAHHQVFVPLVSKILLHLDAVKGGEVARQPLQAFVSGEDTSKLGSGVAAALRAMVDSPSKLEVAELLKGTSHELLHLVQQRPNYRMMRFAVPVHRGRECAACSKGLITGPLFSSHAGDTDYCGDCYISAAAETPDLFTCHLTSESAGTASQRLQGTLSGWMAAAKHSYEDWFTKGAAKGWTGMFGKGFGKSLGKGPDGCPADLISMEKAKLLDEPPRTKERASDECVEAVGKGKGKGKGQVKGKTCKAWRWMPWVRCSPTMPAAPAPAPVDAGVLEPSAPPAPRDGKFE